MEQILEIRESVGTWRYSKKSETRQSLDPLRTKEIVKHLRTPQCQISLGNLWTNYEVITNSNVRAQIIVFPPNHFTHIQVFNPIVNEVRWVCWCAVVRAVTAPSPGRPPLPNQQSKLPVRTSVTAAYRSRIKSFINRGKRSGDRAFTCSDSQRVARVECACANIE